MAWIELHQSVRDNKKTMRLSKLLKINKIQAVGHLVFLWLWALDNCQDGDLSKLTDDEIADAAGWEGESALFVDSLKTARYIDKDTMELHDWFEYAGKLIAQREIQREQTNERVKRYREKLKKEKNSECNADVTRISNGDVTLCNAPTVPNHTVPIEEDEERAREGKVFEFYQQNIGLITPHQSETISQYLDEGIEPDLMIEVMKESLGKGDKWSWIKKVLNNCIEQNVKTLQQFEAKKLETKASNKPPGKTASNKGNFDQRKYSDDEIERLYKE
jgi:DnaD/phage-associated family protein